MKVRIAPEDKNWMTIAEATASKKIIEICKDEMPIEELAQLAVRVASGKNETFRIFDASAWIAGNSRLNNWYSDDSGRLDVWIKFIAFSSYYGCYEVGVYLTDIHSITGDNDAEIRQYMYINAFTQKH